MLRLTMRNLLAHKVRLLMSALAIILGVAFLSGVLTFSNGMQKTFDNIIKGTTPDGAIEPDIEESFQASSTSAQTIKPKVLSKLAALPEVARAVGNVNSTSLSLLGKDKKLISTGGAPTIAFNYNASTNMAGEKILLLEDGQWPSGLDQIALDATAAKKGEYEIGDQVTIISPLGEVEQTFELVGTASFRGGGTAGASLVVFSTEGAQKVMLLGKNAYTGVTLTAAEGVSQEELIASAEPLTPEGFVAKTGDELVKESESTVGTFLGFLSTFLLVFALIAVIVGGFIIVNTFSILVAQRVRELALLRAMGANRRQVTVSVMVEAVVMALIASVIGVGVGWLLALALAAAFGQFGLPISAEALVLTPRNVTIAMVVGLVVTVLAAFFPARKASKVPPVAAMREEALVKSTSLHRRTIVATVFLVAGAALAAYGAVGGAPGNDAIWIGAGALICILSVASISSVIGKPILFASRWFFGLIAGQSGRLAGDNALRDPRRTGATASALMIGLALVSTIGVLAASMNKSISDLVDESFTADFIVQSQTGSPFPTAIADRMREVDGVTAVSQRQDFAGSVGGEKAFGFAASSNYATTSDLSMVDGGPVAEPGQVVLSEGLADQVDAVVGDTVKVGLPTGDPANLKVVGISAAEEFGDWFLVSFDTLKNAEILREDSVLSILASADADIDAVKADLEGIVEEIPIVPVLDKEGFSDSIRAQIDQLLYMIYGLLALAIVIAVIGIINTLGLSVLERTREIGLLRAIGMSRRKLRGMISMESITIAVLGAVLGLLLGVTFGLLLRYALREEFSSWEIPWVQLLVFLGIAVVVGALAAIIPAVRASRMNVLQAISHE